MSRGFESFKVKTNFAWSGEKKDDLGFLEGDFIEVTKVSGEWFYGSLVRNKKCGYFPSHYVTVLEESYNNFGPSRHQNSGQRYGHTPASNNETAYSDQMRSQHQIRKRHTDESLSERSNTMKFGHNERSRNTIPTSVSTPDIANQTRKNPYTDFQKKYMQPPLPPIPKSSSTPMFSNLSHGVDSFPNYSRTRYMDDSLTSSEESFAIMSDFSATSAGSFARHNIARSFQDSLDRSVRFENAETSGILNNSPQLRNENKIGGFLKKWLPGNADQLNFKGEYPKLPDISSLNISANNDANGWIESETQLRRALTITANERRERGMRTSSKNTDIVLYPHSIVSKDLYSNEVLHNRQPGIIDEYLHSVDYRRVDRSTRKLFKEEKRKMLSLESFSQYCFASQSLTSMEQLRGLFVFCTEFFKLIDDNGKTNFNMPPENLEKALQRNYCTPYELTWIFKRMARALNIQCELVFGFLKTPNADNSIFKMNHCWLQLCINDEWRFIDVILGNITNPIHAYLNNRPAKRCESFFFLTAPMDMIYSHVPREYSKQHIVPELDLTIVLSLPVAFPAFFKNRVKLYKFSNGLCDLEDNEIFECTLRIPNDIEIFSSVVIEDTNSMKYKGLNLSLVQIMSQGKRRAVIKAVLPPGTTKGTLFIHSGLKGAQTSLANIHPISMIIPLRLSGITTEFEFVLRTPCVSVQDVELYIKEPQNKILSLKRTYLFQIIQNPSDGIINQFASPRANHKILISSPSGKKYNLFKSDPNLPFGTWHVSTEINEVGRWIALVTSDSGSGWCEFAEWECI